MGPGPTPGAITADGTQSIMGGGPAMIGATRGGGGGKRKVGSQQGGMAMTGGGHTSIGQYEDALAQGAPVQMEAKSTIINMIVLLFLSITRQSFLARVPIVTRPESRATKRAERQRAFDRSTVKPEGPLPRRRRLYFQNPPSPPFTKRGQRGYILVTPLF